MSKKVDFHPTHYLVLHGCGVLGISIDPVTEYVSSSVFTDMTFSSRGLLSRTKLRSCISGLYFLRYGERYYLKEFQPVPGHSS